MRNGKVGLEGWQGWALAVGPRAGPSTSLSPGPRLRKDLAGPLSVTLPEHNAGHVWGKAVYVYCCQPPGLGN